MELQNELYTKRVDPNILDRVAILRKGVTVAGTLLSIHSNKHLYTVHVDGELKPVTVQWWQVTKLHTLYDVVESKAPPKPWWRRWLRLG